MSDPEPDDQPACKRRRGFGAAATLSKPFKSPLRTRGVPIVPLSLSDMTQDPKFEPEPAQDSTSRTADAEPLTTAQGLSIQDGHVVTTRSVYWDSELLGLQKKHRNLFSQRMTQEKALETARQALRIESSGTDIDLEMSINKWRLVGQEAAEEVFTGARERVARMGGVKAWRQRCKQYAPQWDGFEAQDQGNKYDEDMDVHPDNPDHRLEKTNDTPTQGNDTDEEFTMEFMLKTLNIEHKTIGFDAVMGKWARK
ncbi:DNA repair protein Dds20/Sfr1 [Penicillium sp. IBT 18751x]|nr:DNA repair protein Dds20/Sfr1 [Penicillium sp. IBT 18751x]